MGVSAVISENGRICMEPTHDEGKGRGHSEWQHVACAQVVSTGAPNTAAPRLSISERKARVSQLESRGTAYDRTTHVWDKVMDREHATGWG